MEYAKLLAKLLGLVFAQHGTTDELFLEAVDHYEEIKTNFICIDQMLTKQKICLPLPEIEKMKETIRKEF